MQRTINRSILVKRLREASYEIETMGADWFAAWQASHPGSHRTVQSYQGLLQNTILPRLGRFELTELTPLRLKRFFAGLPAERQKIPINCCGPSSSKG